MTTKAKHKKYYIHFFTPGMKKDSYLVINQGRVFDMQRFFSRKTKISDLEFEQIKKLLRSKYFPEAF